MLVLDAARPGLLGFIVWMKADRRPQGLPRPARGPAGNGEEAGEPPGEEFRRIFDRFFGPVLHFFLNRGIPYEDSRDLTQETFLRVYRGFERFRGDASVQTWLFQIATNLWRNHVRHQRAGKREAREVSLEGAMEKGVQVSADRSLARGSVGAGPLAGILADERVQLLRQALESLPPQMRRCVLLRIDQELKYREIAEVMQIAVDTVKSQISQAKDRLERELGPYFDLSGFGGDGG
jgi:RNA polymerase sigma-70 factor (ECF subfamily)